MPLTYRLHRLCGGREQGDDRPFTEPDSAVYPVENMYDRIVIKYDTYTQGRHREGLTDGATTGKTT